MTDITRKATKSKWNQQNVKAKFRLWPTDYITVCSSCLQASCWQGEFYCEEYKTAGTVARTVRDLIKLDLENPSYWVKSRVLRRGLNEGPE